MKKNENKNRDTIVVPKSDITIAVFEKEKEAVNFIADEIQQLIADKRLAGENCVLGLATGSTPALLYDELVNRKNDDKLSFNNVITFNLDEYYPMCKKSENSFYHFMHRYLFDRVDVLPSNINIPDGECKSESIREYCKQYEKRIADAGGIDIQILGIGLNGHIGFNEPGSAYDSITRLVNLDPITIGTNASAFSVQSSIPFQAITMGIGTILKARRIILMAWGSSKAKIIAETIAQREPQTTLPASFLHYHPNCSFILDKQSASLILNNTTGQIKRQK